MKTRKNIRIKDYDYSKPGYYFITICTKDRICLLGEIKNGEMKFNDSGLMIKKWYLKIQTKFPNIECKEHIIMPNHFHCIIYISDNNQNTIPHTNVVGADPRACPENGNERKITGEHMGAPLNRVVQWFKTMTTNEYIRGVKKFGWEPFPGKLWQRNYYEHIIRNDNELINAQNYIIYNPINWENDENYR